MQDQDKATTALIRSMKQALARDHGIEVPHSALRAVYLQAQGQNPHAFARANTPTVEDKLNGKVQGLANALLGMQLPTPVRQESFDGQDVRRLYLVVDEDGCMTRLSLDSEGEAVIPEQWMFSDRALLLQTFAWVPKVSQYGLPDYIADPQGFFGRFGLRPIAAFRSRYEDLGDDSGDTAFVDVRIDEEEWSRLLLEVLSEADSVADQVAEWVGQHYGRMIHLEPPKKKADWFGRYLESHEQSQVDALRSVAFEFVTPDEDGDTVAAALNLDTGEVTLQASVPAYISSPEVRTRIWTGDSGLVGDGDDLTVRFRDGHWYVYAADLRRLCFQLRYCSSVASL